MLLDTLKHNGLRLTRQRRIVCEVLERARGHLDAAAILAEAQAIDGRIDRATVYRTIDLLKQQGLLEELDLLHFQGKEHFYELKNQSRHVHVGCQGCGKILEMNSKHLDRLSEEIERKTGFAVESMRIEVSALCPRCRKSR